MPIFTVSYLILIPSTYKIISNALPLRRTSYSISKSEFTSELIPKQCQLHLFIC